MGPFRLLLVLIVLAGCGGGVSGPEGCDAPEVTVAEAKSNAGEVFTITGYIVAAGGEGRLCESLSASRPPSCSGASVSLPGFDYEQFTRRADVEQAGNVAWTPDETSVLGSVVDEHLRGAGCL